MSNAAPVTREELLFTARLLRQQADRLLHAAMRADTEERIRDIEAARDLERRAEQMEKEAEAMR